MTIAGFKRKAVLDAAREAVANLQGELNAWDRKAEALRQESRDRWVAEGLPQLKVARDKLTAALKKGGTVTSADVGSLDRLLYTELSDWQLGNKIGYRDDRGNRREQQSTKQRIVAYQGVIRLLEAQEGEDDDVLSMAALKNLGINKLGDLFRAAADKGGSVEGTVI